MPIELRPYQQKMVDEARTELAKGKKSVLCVSATGSGKSYCFMYMAERCRGKVLVLVHRGELKDQHIGEFRKNNILLNNVVVETVQTVYRHLDDYHDVKMVIADESHLFLAKTFKATIDYFAEQGAYTIGFSASPCRLDGSSMSDVFECMVEGPQTAELIQKKRLCEFEYFAPLTVDVSNLRKQRGDYVKSDVESLMEPAIYGRVVEEYKRLCPDKQAIAFCCSIQHSKQVAKQFADAGIMAAHLDGNTPKKERERIMERFRAGEVKILKNVNLFAEGLSVDGIGAVLMLRPTASLALCLQQWGRGLRYQPGKVCTIIDTVGNYTRFGLPNEHREWTLNGVSKQHREHNDDGTFTIRQCPSCYKVFPTANKCPYCGAEYPMHPRELKVIEEIEMKRITEEEAKREKERKNNVKEAIRNARSYEDFLKIERDNHYKHGWAYFRAKQRGYI